MYILSIFEALGNEMNKATYNVIDRKWVFVNKERKNIKGHYYILSNVMEDLCVFL